MITLPLLLQSLGVMANAQRDSVPSGAPVGEGAVGAPPPLRDVFDAHAPYVWRCLRRLGVPDGDADDVCQEVFLVVHRKLPTFDPAGSMRAWLYGITVRKASDYRRLSRNVHESVTDEPPEVVFEGDPDRMLDERTARAFLDRVLDRLDSDKRAVFVLYEIEQLPMADVARAVDVPLQTAYSRLHAARKHVESAIQRANARKEREVV